MKDLTGSPIPWKKIDSKDFFFLQTDDDIFEYYAYELDKGSVDTLVQGVYINSLPNYKAGYFDDMKYGHVSKWRHFPIDSTLTYNSEMFKFTFKSRDVENIIKDKNAYLDSSNLYTWRATFTSKPHLNCFILVPKSHMLYWVVRYL